MLRPIFSSARFARSTIANGIRSSRRALAALSGSDEESLLDLAINKVQASAVSYPITFLLREAKAGHLQSSDRILQKLHAIGDGDLSTYLVADDILQIAYENMDYIQRNYGGEVKSWMTAFEQFREQAKEGGDPDSISMLEFDDHAEHSRLVYGIALNKIRRRVTVIFRGTYAEGTRDWKRNLQYDPCQVDIPAEMHQFGKEWREMKPFMHLHTGFYEYLFRNKERGRIRARAVRRDPRKHIRGAERLPGYALHITGHSLGGSLALLLSFFLASSDRFPQIGCITCVSVGSPSVGDQSFLEAFRILERAGRIRYLRITNQGDPIVHLPPFSWYRHVGLNLCLERGGGHRLLYPKSSDIIDPYTNWKALLECGTSEPVALRNNHLLAEYLRRLSREKVAVEKEGIQDTIASRCLGDYYRDENILGSSVAET